MKTFNDRFTIIFNFSSIKILCSKFFSSDELLKMWKMTGSTADRVSLFYNFSHKHFPLSLALEENLNNIQQMIFLRMLIMRIRRECQHSHVIVLVLRSFLQLICGLLTAWGRGKKFIYIWEMSFSFIISSNVGGIFIWLILQISWGVSMKGMWKKLKGGRPNLNKRKIEWKFLFFLN